MHMSCGSEVCGDHQSGNLHVQQTIGRSDDVFLAPMNYRTPYLLENNETPLFIALL